MTTWIEFPVAPAAFAPSHIPPEVLKGHPHVTCVYFGALKPTQRDDILQTLRTTAIGVEPIAAKISGLGTFYLGPVRLPVLLVDSLGACLFWHRLRSFLAGAGLPVDETHGYQPHVTLNPEGIKKMAGWTNGFRPNAITLGSVALVTKGKDKVRHETVVPLGEPPRVVLPIRGVEDTNIPVRHLDGWESSK